MANGSVFVLVVDNDIEFAAAAARSFENVGMRTKVALNSAPQIQFFADNAVDVFVTNIKREFQSRKLVQMLKSWKPGVPIIVMTAHFELLEDAPSPWSVQCEPLEIAKLCRAIRVRQVH